MRKVLNGYRLVSHRYYFRHALPAAALLVTGLLVVAFAQMGGTPSKASPSGVISNGCGPTTQTVTVFGLAGAHPTATSTTHPRTVTVTKWKTKTKTVTVTRTVTRTRTKVVCETVTQPTTETTTTTEHDTVTVTAVLPTDPAALNTDTP